MNRRLGLVGVLLGAVVASSWPATGAAEPSRATPTGTWIAAVEGTEAYVAVVVGDGGERRGRPAAVYVCDGAATAEWFTGSTRRARLDLSSATGGQVVARLTKGTVTGRVTLPDGTSLSFRARRAANGAGLYHAEDTKARVGYVGGWIVRSDGTQRGALRTVEGVVANPLIDPGTDHVVVVPNVGSFRPRPLIDPNPDFGIDPR